MAAPGIQFVDDPEFIAEARAHVDELHAKAAVNDDKKRLDIYDDFTRKDIDGRVISIPQPTLGFLLLYGERKRYFWDGKLGLGRLLVVLNRMREGGGDYIRRLRAGGLIPDGEARKALKGIKAVDAPHYFALVHAAEIYGDEEKQKADGKPLGSAGAFAQLIEFTKWDLNYIIYGLHYVAFLNLFKGMSDLSKAREDAMKNPDKGLGI